MATPKMYGKQKGPDDDKDRSVASPADHRDYEKKLDGDGEYQIMPEGTPTAVKDPVALVRKGLGLTDEAEA